MSHPAQSTCHILMVRPATFRKNEETAGNNHYQQDAQIDDVHQAALDEFDGMVDDLRGRGVNVMVVEDDPTTDTPDALFPNNWVSFHADGRVGLYPMFAPNRRLERGRHPPRFGPREWIDMDEIVDFTEFEGTTRSSRAREHGPGPGARQSLRRLEPRTDRDAFAHWCESMDLEGVIFEANQTVGEARMPIYHTNVMMAVGTGWAAVCLDSIDHPTTGAGAESLQEDGLTVVDLTEDQINRFAGNMLEVATDQGDKLIVMSSRAHDALTDDQRATLGKFGTLVHNDLHHIETCGGGSARCMMAEVHLPRPAQTNDAHA